MKKWNKKKMSLRYKFFAAFLFVGIVSFLLLGLGVYHYSVQIFYENFVDYHFNLTKNIAASISGKEHSQFKEESSIKLKSFQHYFNYLRKLHSNEQHVTYLYTLNYNSEKNEFQYAVDPYEIKTDTVWIETPYFGLEAFSNENGEIVLKYNNELYTENFQIEFENKIIPFRFERKQYLRTVYVFDNTKLIEYSNFPKPIWFTPKGIIQYNESHEVEANFEDQNFKITYFLSQKGSFSSLPGGEYQDFFNMTSTIRETFFKGSAFIFPEPVPMAYGKFLVAFATILDFQNKPSGVVLLEISDKVVRSYKRKIEYIFLSIFAVIALFSILLAFLFAKYLTNPIYALSSAAKEIAKGNMETSVDINRRDELGELATSFNHMAKSLAEAYTELRATNKAYSRFVPIELLQLLGRKSILEVKLGDQVRKEMTVLFADIWSFTTISEKMTPEENFEFINGFLERMSPIIRMNHGVIDKYIGDCIMALFPTSPLDAIKAATEMLESLKSYNAQRKQKNEFSIKIGVGIHTGTLMLGTIGERERMESTVISDVVNVASRIEGLTRRFESEIIISEESIKWIPEIHDIYKMRYLGKVEVKGKTELIPIYEPISLVDNLKAQTKEEFEIAVFQYEFGNFSSAKLGFEKILSLNPNDGSVKYYLSKIDSHLSKTELEPIQNITI